MNIIKRSFPILLIFFLLFSITERASAQENRTNQESNSQFNFNFNSVLDGYYYQDALSALLGSQSFSFFEDIDINKYRLGPSDLITVTIQGSQTVVLRALLVNPQGDIVVPMLGSVRVADQTIAEAQETINKASSRVFKNPETTITLEQAKPLSIHVNGGVPNPGKQILAPFSRVDAAIFGSVYEIQQTENNDENNQSSPRTLLPITNTIKLLDAGNLSLRNIKIIHKDGSTSKADLYAYFKAGKLSYNPVVQNGDQIIVDKLSRDSQRIGISGAVKIEYNLEYSNTDTPSLLLEMAGGYKPEADTTKLLVFRHENGETKRIEVIRNEWEDFELLPNDRVIVPTNRTSNSSAAAWVYGEVGNPGSYPIRNGETSALELLEFSGKLTNNALPSAAYLNRGGSLENEIPNKFNTDVLKRTSNQLEQGFQYLDLETRLSQDKVFVDLTDEEQLSKVKIYNGDRLYVPRNEKTIFVFGQVNNPGYYPYTDPSQNARGYIDRAGGFALSANSDRIFIIKAGSGTWYKPSETGLESGDRIFVDRIPYDELNAQRSFEVQKEQIKNTRIQLIMTAITTITGIITTYVAITR
jgi:protein involved in polysaccharide export with SLBB domain